MVRGSRRLTHETSDGFEGSAIEGALAFPLRIVLAAASLGILFEAHSGATLAAPAPTARDVPSPTRPAEIARPRDDGGPLGRPRNLSLRPCPD